MRACAWPVRGMLLAVAVALVAFGCGGSNPDAPSGNGKVVLRGTVLGAQMGAGGAGSVSSSSVGSGSITVTVVQNTSITTTISSNGTFELDDVPDSAFAVQFARGGTDLGAVHIPGVGHDHVINIVVQVTVVNVIIININVDGDPVPVPSTRPPDGEDDDEDD